MSNANIEELDKTAINDLEGAASWLISEATGKLYADKHYGKSPVKNRPSALNDDLFNKFTLPIYNVPELGEEYEIVRYIIHSRGIYYDIQMLMDTEYDGYVYEYWLISIDSKKSATLQKRESRFIITRSVTKSGERQILKETDQFFHTFDVNDYRVFELDFEHDLKLRYILHPDYFVKSFSSYPDITQDKVVIRDGCYVLEK